MARKFRKIDPRFWGDEKVMRLSAHEKLIALYVLTAPTSNRIGLYQLSIGAASDYLGMSGETFRERFGNVCQTLRWGFDEGVSVVFLPSWWEYNRPENPNVLKGVLADLDDLPETRLFAEFKETLQPLAETLGVTLPKRLANVGQTFGKSGAGAGEGTGAVTGSVFPPDPPKSELFAEEPETTHPAQISFRVNRKEEWLLTEAVFNAAKERHPEYTEEFILEEIRSAAEWTFDHEEKNRKLKGMPAFVRNWLKSDITIRKWQTKQRASPTTNKKDPELERIERADRLRREQEQNQ